MLSYELHERLAVPLNVVSIDLLLDQLKINIKVNVLLIIQKKKIQDIKRK